MHAQKGNTYQQDSADAPPSIVWIKKKQPGSNKVTWEGIERLFIN